jgi:CBS domain-containing protein
LNQNNLKPNQFMQYDQFVGQVQHRARLASPEVVCCQEDQDIADAVRLMEEKQIRRIAVKDRQQRLVGIVSLGDLAVRTRDERLAGEVLERVSEREPATTASA